MLLVNFGAQFFLTQFFLDRCTAERGSPILSHTALGGQTSPPQAPPATLFDASNKCSKAQVPVSPSFVSLPMPVYLRDWA